MISLSQSIVLALPEIPESINLFPFMIMFTLLFSVVSSPRSKYAAESNRQLLLRLLALSPLSQKELIENSRLSKSNLNYAINTLIREGRVTKKKNIGFDMRSVIYQLIE